MNKNVVVFIFIACSVKRMLVYYMVLVTEIHAHINQQFYTKEMKACTSLFKAITRICSIAFRLNI